jgi:hypothetical protein
MQPFAAIGQIKESPSGGAAVRYPVALAARPCLRVCNLKDSHVSAC